MKKGKIVAANMLITTIYQVLTILFGLIIPRYFLTEYGAIIHGLTSTITNILSYVTLLNAGLLTASVQALYKPLSLHETENVSSIINAVKKYYNKVGILYMISIFSVALILPIFVSDEIPELTVFFVMLVMGMSTILDSFLGAKYRILVQADQKYWLISLCNIVSLTLRSILQILLIYAHFSVVIVQLIPSVMTVITYIILKIYVNKSYPYLDNKSVPCFSALGQRKAALAHQISGVVVNNTDTVLLTIFENLTAVSIYSVYQLVFTHLYSFITTIFNMSTVASFGHMLVVSSLEKVKETYSKYEFLFYYFISVILGITATMILPFIQIYTAGVGNINYVDIKLQILFMTVSLLNNGRVPGVMLINAAGHYKKTQYRALAEAIINLVSSLILIQWFGIYGVLIGTVLSFSYRTLDIIVYVNRHILSQSFEKSLRRLIITIITVWIAYFCMQIIIPSTFNSWLQWSLYALISGIVSFAVSTGLWWITEPKMIKEMISIIGLKLRLLR